MRRRYLPSVFLPHSVVACTDLAETCRDADVIIFILSHMHLPGILKQLRAANCIKPTAVGVSMMKGIEFTADGPMLLSDLLKEQLQLQHMAVVMGANLASDIAYDRFVESTVASHDAEVKHSS